MDKFEEYIKARYLVDYEHLKEKYPNVPVGEFYGDEKDLWNYRQAELDQLQSQINEMAEVGLSQESVIREKDKRIKKAVALLNEIHKRSLDNPEVWNLVDDVWEALRGKDQYTEHRSKAEQQINKGARLTKHQIDLGDKNANS